MGCINQSKDQCGGVEGQKNQGRGPKGDAGTEGLGWRRGLRWEPGGDGISCGSITIPSWFSPWFPQASSHGFSHGFPHDSLLIPPWFPYGFSHGSSMVPPTVPPWLPHGFPHGFLMVSPTVSPMLRPLVSLTPPSPPRPLQSPSVPPQGEVQGEGSQVCPLPGRHLLGLG